VDTGNSCVTGAKTNNPIQLSDFHPVNCQTLARIGSPHDGGYIVPLEAVKAARALLSFGLSHDWTFERDFKKHNPDAIVHCYDHTVSLWTAFQYSIGQLLRSILLFRPDALRRAFTWIDYKSFFRSEGTHFRQRIWRDNENNSATIDDAFTRLPAECPVFVKMDIEGSEYHVLDDLLRHSNHIVAIAIEFHDLDTVSGLFNSLIKKIKDDFYIVHIHGNNFAGMTSFNFPIAPEITFLNKSFFNSAPQPSSLKYPIPGLDRPNYPRLPDFTFDF
jgi:FkbM family methyltransferase